MTFELFSELAPKDRILLPELIFPAVGNPTQQRLKNLLTAYSAENNWVLIVAKISGQMVGCIGLDRGDHKSLAILHIAVSDKFQRRGVGKALIAESIRRFSPKEVVAETDDEAVGFYKKSQFEILETIGSEWSIQRYRLRRAMAS